MHAIAPGRARIGCARGGASNASASPEHPMRARAGPASTTSQPRLRPLRPASSRAVGAAIEPAHAHDTQADFTGTLRLRDGSHRAVGEPEGGRTEGPTEPDPVTRPNLALPSPETELGAGRTEGPQPAESRVFAEPGKFWSRIDPKVGRTEPRVGSAASKAGRETSGPLSGGRLLWGGGPEEGVGKMGPRSGGGGAPEI